MTPKSLLAGIVLAAATLAPAPAHGQADEARPADVASPEAVVAAAYASIIRAPGEGFQWDRFRTLFLPGAIMVPNTEQTEGEFRTLTPEEFVTWAEGLTPELGGPSDRGFVEEEIASSVERYGDIAHVLSTYAKRFHDSEEILGRGINSFQLVHNDGRWWIVSIAWDEEAGAGPIPAEYLP